jgi:hypothetical protein
LAAQTAVDHCVRGSVEQYLVDQHLPADSAACYLAAQRLQAVPPADCLAERCSAAARADLRSDLRSAVAHFPRSVAAVLPAERGEPS